MWMIRIGAEAEQTGSKGAKNPETPKPEELYGGEYWRQAVFYKELLDHDKLSTYPVNTIAFDFI
jgi:DNA helicase-2/ATP-dependent DNA helicase PcrA